jgi:hypothetical protein
MTDLQDTSQVFKISPRSRYGNWPMTSKDGKEPALECKHCGSQKISFHSMWSGLPSGPGGRYRLGDQSKDYVVCEVCKRSAVRYDPVDSNTHVEYFAEVEDEIRYYLYGDLKQVFDVSSPEDLDDNLNKFLQLFAKARGVSFDFVSSIYKKSVAMRKLTGNNE